MPPCSDPNRIRAVLNRDRAWALYPLGDLEPRLFGRGSWWCSDGAVTLLYHGFDPPILCAVGSAENVRALLDEMPRPPRVYLHLRPDIADVVREHYAVPDPRQMIRMVLQPADYRPEPGSGAQRLGGADASALAALYRDGEANGESPGFFTAEMVDQGVYFGVRDHGDLIAVAGTHVFSDSE